MNNHMLLVNVPQGFTKQVIEIAEQAGSKGATILPGKMATILEQPVRLDKDEPEMETVLILAPEQLTTRLIVELERFFTACQAGFFGSCFVVPVNNVLGTDFSNV